MAKTKPKKPAHRPTKYQANMPEKAEALCREKGYTDAQLAKALHLHRGTLYKYKSEQEAFAEAIQRGKDAHDSGEVESALLKRAKGYAFEEKTYETDTEGQERLVRRVVKHEPGNVTAQIIWLKNRQPDRWKDKQDVVHSGKVTFETVNYGSTSKDN